MPVQSCFWYRAVTVLTRPDSPSPDTTDFQLFVSATILRLATLAQRENLRCDHSQLLTGHSVCTTALGRTADFIKLAVPDTSRTLSACSLKCHPSLLDCFLVQSPQSDRLDEKHYTRPRPRQTKLLLSYVHVTASSLPARVADRWVAIR